MPAAPLFRTGDTVDGVTFSPDPQLTPPQLAVADGQLIIVTEASGPAIVERSDAVWRVSAEEAGFSRSAVAHSGMLLDVGNDVTQTIEVIHQTIVAPDGHVAIVVSTDAFGVEAIAMEGVTIGSGFVKAVLSFTDEMPSRDEAPRFASDLTPVNQPRLVPPGQTVAPAV